MKKLRVLCSILFVFFFAPWYVSCKKAEQSAAIAYSLDLEYDEKNRVLSGTETVAFENRTEYQGEGIVLYASDVKECEPLKEEMVYLSIIRCKIR